MRGRIDEWSGTAAISGHRVDGGDTLEASWSE